MQRLIALITYQGLLGSVSLTRWDVGTYPHLPYSVGKEDSRKYRTISPN